MKTAGRMFAALGAALILTVAPIAHAQYPDKPVRMIVPTTAGGTADILARYVAQKLADLWAKPVVVDNRPGGLGVVGTEALARAAPDGYTMGLLFSTHPIVPLVVKNLSYDVTKDFVSVAPIATAPGLLVVSGPIANAKTAQEAFAMAKAAPGKYNYASPVALTAGHRSMELLKRESGAQIQHVAYKGGAQAVTDLIGGQVQFLVIAIPSVISHVQAGKLRALGVTTAQRFPGLPDLPTLAETGFPGFDSAEWYGLFMPARVPPEIVARVSADVQRLLRAPEANERFIAMGAVARPGDGAELDRMFRRDYETWSRLMPEVKLQAD